MEAAISGLIRLGAAKFRGRKEHSGITQELGIGLLKGEHAVSQGTVSDDDVPPPPYEDNRPLFQQLPDKVVLQIASLLGLVSRASLMYTNTHLRN